MEELAWGYSLCAHEWEGVGVAHRLTPWESSLPFIPRRQNLPRKTMPAASQMSCGNLWA